MDSNSSLVTTTKRCWSPCLLRWSTQVSPLMGGTTEPIVTPSPRWSLFDSKVPYIPSPKVGRVEYILLILLSLFQWLRSVEPVAKIFSSSKRISFVLTQQKLKSLVQKKLKRVLNSATPCWTGERAKLFVLEQPRLLFWWRIHWLLRLFPARFRWRTLALLLVGSLVLEPCTELFRKIHRLALCCCVAICGSSLFVRHCVVGSCWWGMHSVSSSRPWWDFLLLARWCSVAAGAPSAPEIVRRVCDFDCTLALGTVCWRKSHWYVAHAACCCL